LQREQQFLSWGQPMASECTWLIPEISTPDLIFATCEDGRLMKSTDQGHTWSLDRRNGIQTAESREILVAKYAEWSE